MSEQSSGLVLMVMDLFSYLATDVMEKTTYRFVQPWPVTTAEIFLQDDMDAVDRLRRHRLAANCDACGFHLYLIPACNVP
jgi:hypothetical protein